MINKTDDATTGCQDYVVCGCNNVWRDEIIKSINQGATTIESIKEKTLASTGCGSCTREVEKILAQQNQKKACCGGGCCSKK